MVGRVLDVPDAVIDQIEEDESKVSDRCYSKCNCVVFVVIIGKHGVLRCGQVKVFKGHGKLKELISRYMLADKKG